MLYCISSKHNIAFVSACELHAEWPSCGKACERSDQCLQALLQLMYNGSTVGLRVLMNSMQSGPVPCCGKACERSDECLQALLQLMYY